MKLKEARQIALKYKVILEPYCERIEIAGSIRREKPKVRDIEIVCIAKSGPGWDSQLEGYIKLMKRNGDWKILKNGLKYKQIILPEGIKLDLFIANRENFGNIYLIRTGSMEFSKWIMGTRTKQVSLKQRDGYLWRGEEKLKCFEEIDVFKLLKMRYVEPKHRNEFFVTGCK